MFKILTAILGEKKTQGLSTEYNPQEYWEERHKKHGFNLTGVQVSNLSNEENEKMYSEAREVFLNFCKAQQIDFANAHTLEIGCGMGLFTKVFKDAGGIDYTGIDITDTLFEGLCGQFSDYKFRMLDITTQQLEDTYDLIMMIDVTQHVVDDDAFFATMENVKSHLNEGGVFIVTSWLTDEVVNRTFYEVSRPLNYYKKAFPNYKFSEPVDFRWKYLFSIKK